MLNDEIQQGKTEVIAKDEHIRVHWMNGMLEKVAPVAAAAARLLLQLRSSQTCPSVLFFWWWRRLR